MSTAQPMETAPTDGTRILVRAEVWHYDTYGTGGWRLTGRRWLEAWHDGDRWQEWCGAKRVKCNGTVVPTAWAENPRG